MRFAGHETYTQFSQSEISFIFSYSEKRISVREEEGVADWDNFKDFANINFDDYNELYIQGYNLFYFVYIVLFTINQLIKDLKTY